MVRSSMAETADMLRPLCRCVAARHAWVSRMELDAVTAVTRYGGRHRTKQRCRSYRTH